MQGKALQDFVIDKIDDLKGQDIVAIDVHGKSSITDCMIICTGTSDRNPCAFPVEHTDNPNFICSCTNITDHGSLTLDGRRISLYRILDSVKAVSKTIPIL